MRTRGGAVASQSRDDPVLGEGSSDCACAAVVSALPRPLSLRAAVRARGRRLGCSERPGG